MGRLEGKIAIVTGANAGIGEATALTSALTTDGILPPRQRPNSAGVSLRSQAPARA